VDEKKRKKSGGQPARYFDSRIHWTLEGGVDLPKVWCVAGLGERGEEL